jgi:hypothetical protein
VLCHGFHIFLSHTFHIVVTLSFLMALGLVSHQPKYVHRISINSLHLAEIYFPFGGVSHLILSIFRIQVHQVMSPRLLEPLYAMHQTA